MVRSVTSAILWGLVVLISGCGTHAPTTRESRGIAFPLKGCTDEHLAEAARRLQAPVGPPQFDDSWVCVTDTAAQTKERQRTPLSGSESVPAVRDASSPPAIQQDPSTATLTPEERESLARTLREARLRTALELPYVNATPDSANLGIALSGGGSKAAAFGSGVLAGLADIDQLDSASYISTVSGGGYAAYFYYTHKIFPHLRKDSLSAVNSKELYRDCVRLPGPTTSGKPQNEDDYEATAPLKARIEDAGACSRYELVTRGTKDKPPPPNHYQGFVRCQQDMLNPGNCSIESTTGDIGLSGAMVVSTLLTAIPSYLSTIVFDWGIPTSPAAQTYRTGIGLAYGATVRRPSSLGEIPYKEGYMQFECDSPTTGFALDCTRGPGHPAPVPLTFEELQEIYRSARTDPQRRVPFWIINAVAPQQRSFFGWWNISPPNTSSSDIFEMTAVSHGSGRYGYVSASPSLHKLTVLDAVGAAAAFLDPNQNAVGSSSVMRGLLGIGMRLGNVDWGIDISNYNVTDARRTLHTTMPFPFFDAPISKHILHGGQPEEDKERVGSVFIRLIDGGNGENLGANALLKRGARNIVISDAAQDELGNFADVCELRRRLSHLPGSNSETGGRFAKHLYLPGLPGFSSHCDTLRTADPPKGYGVHHWPFDFPVLVGCVRKQKMEEGGASCDNLDTTTQNGQPDARLFIVKPAINVAHVRAQQVWHVQNSGNETRVQMRDCILPSERVTAAVASQRMLNCDSALFFISNWEGKLGDCQRFPQHSTVLATANSSNSIYAAYRELGRQYVHRLEPMLKQAAQGPNGGREIYERLAHEQFKQAQDFKPQTLPCDKTQHTRTQSKTAILGASNP